VVGRRALAERAVVYGQPYRSPQQKGADTGDEETTKCTSGNGIHKKRDGVVYPASQHSEVQGRAVLAGQARLIALVLTRRNKVVNGTGQFPIPK
jgi:hypothetical protein